MAHDHHQLAGGFRRSCGMRRSGHWLPGRLPAAMASLPPEPSLPVISWGESQHLGAVAADGGTVLAPATAGDGGGLVSRIHPVAGPTWTARAAGEPVTGIRAAAGQVLVSSTAGRLVALDAGTGEQRWAYQLPGRRQRRLLTAPLVTPAGQVITGDIGAVACLDLPSGGLRWEVSGPGSPDTLLTYGTGLVTPQLAVLPFGGPGLGLTALHLADASLAWTDPPGTPPPSSSLVPIGDGDALVLRTATPSLERLDLATGRVRWRTPLHGRYSTAAPLVTEHAITWSLAMGSSITSTATPVRSPRTTRSTACARHTGPTGPPAPGRRPRRCSQVTARCITLLDGSVWRLQPTSGAQLIGDVQATVTTQPTPVGRATLAVLTTDATLHFLDLDMATSSLRPASRTS